MARSRKRFAARRNKEKRDKLLAERAFPRGEFNEYYKKHSEDLKRAVYDAYLDELANNRVFMVSRGAYGKVQKQEVFAGNVAKFIDYVPRKMSGTMLKDTIPDIGHVIYNMILECDNMALVHFAMEFDEKRVTKILMEALREKNLKADLAVTDIRNRFGYEAVQRGIMFYDKELSGLDAKADDHMIHPVAYFQNGNKVISGDE